MTSKERFIIYLKEKGIGQTAFEESSGLSRGQLAQKTGFSASTLEKIAVACRDLNVEWLLTGEGEMLKSPSSATEEETPRPPQGVPYYADLPVSAGRLDVITADARPSGYVEIPGLHATALFPVVGCSMKPDINPGDVIGIVPLESWDRPDPDKVYLVITADDRMIKHLEADDTDPDVLWCVSPNYRRFSIRKSEIRFIYRVSYVGRLL